MQQQSKLSRASSGLLFDLKNDSDEEQAGRVIDIARRGERRAASGERHDLRRTLEEAEVENIT
jgi:hypothetical protein